MVEDDIPPLDELPFDARYAGKAHLLDGVEKVRAFDDPAMRKTIYELQRDLTLKRWAGPTSTTTPAKTAPKETEQAVLPVAQIDPVEEQAELERRYGR